MHVTWPACVWRIKARSYLYNIMYLQKKYNFYGSSYLFSNSRYLTQSRGWVDDTDLQSIVLLPSTPLIEQLPLIELTYVHV